MSQNQTLKLIHILSLFELATLRDLPEIDGMEEGAATKGAEDDIEGAEFVASLLKE